MTLLTKLFKWFLIPLTILLLLAVVYVRLSRTTDAMIYSTKGKKFTTFKTDLKYKVFYLDVEEDVKLHGVLFQPDSVQPIATIFHHSGQKMDLNSCLNYYKPLLKNGFQIFSYERRGMGKSNGKSNNSKKLKNDALRFFDTVAKTKEVENTPIIIWGQSIGSMFATLIASKRNNQIKGAILECPIPSFPEIGKVYARMLNLEKIKWIIPVLMNNDFPAEEHIKNIDKPITVIHSTEDEMIPFSLGKELFKASNKNTTEFWEVKGEHMEAFFLYEDKYVDLFKKLI